MRQLKEISYDCHNDIILYHTITIDFIECTEDLFSVSPDDLTDAISLISDLLSLSYGITTTIEIFNPRYDNEIADLTDILSLIDIRIAYIESLDF